MKTITADGHSIAPHAHPDHELLLIEKQIDAIERDVAPLRKFLVDVRTKHGGALPKDRWPAFRPAWDILQSNADKIEDRVLALRATTLDGVKAKSRVAEWLRQRCPGLHMPLASRRVDASVAADISVMSAFV